MQRQATSTFESPIGWGFGNDELKDLGAEFDNMISRLQTVITAQRQLLYDVVA